MYKGWAVTPHHPLSSSTIPPPGHVITNIPIIGCIQSYQSLSCQEHFLFLLWPFTCTSNHWTILSSYRSLLYLMPGLLTFCFPHVMNCCVVKEIVRPIRKICNIHSRTYFSNTTNRKTVIQLRSGLLVHHLQHIHV